MEYKLFRRPPRKEDFLKAIQYEINLDKLRKIRKERLGVINGSNDSEFGISNRIHALYGVSPLINHIIIIIIILSFHARELPKDSK
jgi:regulator of PEP synthase PpsR (kinase-PPPase family)